MGRWKEGNEKTGVVSLQTKRESRNKGTVRRSAVTEDICLGDLEEDSEIHDVAGMK
jgi:hypothetical protein